MSDKGYIVVFRTISDTPYNGAITWTSYPSKEVFDEEWTKLNEKGWYEIVAEGVTDDEAVEYARSTPDSVHFSVVAAKAAELLGS